ncbi:MAG: mobile mystery protein A [Ignavibacteriales bacterium]|nr:mobile mystery protein A [Ignavibacteriales bacterium]MCB9219996.1 mobile mystery protein A [Ignavibacteriales bacterium]
MDNQKHKLQLEQLDKKLNEYGILKNLNIPSKGWIYAVRNTLNMSLKQFGKRLNITSQSAKEIETRESSGSITLKNISEAAEALHMRFVYCIIPQSESLTKMIENRALQLAKEIVNRTSQSMSLEDQENNPERLEKAIKEKAENIKNEMPRYLWD